MRYTINLCPGEYPFASTPEVCTLEGDKIVPTHAVLFSAQYAPRAPQLFVLGDIHGAIAGAWASCELNALDDMVNAGLLDDYQIGEEHVTQNEDGDEDSDDGCEFMRLGDAAEPFTFDQPWLVEALPLEQQPHRFIVDVAKAVGARLDTLDDVSNA